MMIEKDRRIRLPALLAAARDAPCCYCGVRDGTTVAAHGPKWLAGGGMSVKPDDFAVAYLCSTHHDQVDGRQGTELSSADRLQIWLRAHMRTQRYWWMQGIIGIKK